MTGNVMVVTLSVFTGDAVHYSASDMQKTIQSHTLRVGLARNTPNRTLRYWQRMPRTCSCSEIERLKNTLSFQQSEPKFWWDQQHPCQTQIWNSSLSVLDSCLDFRWFSGICLQTKTGIWLQKEEISSTWVSCFGTLWGRGPYPESLLDQEEKVAQMEKPLAGWAVQERWRGLNLLQLGSDSQMLLQDCDTHFLLLCQRLLYCFKPKWPCCGHVISLPSFHT